MDKLSDGLTGFEAWKSTDGARFFDYEEAKAYQYIINRGDKPCISCRGKGTTVESMGGNAVGCYEKSCTACHGSGYFVQKVEWVPGPNPHD